MTDKEYDQQKRECWKTFTTMSFHKAFNYAFDRAYALGKQEKDAEKSKKPKRMCLRDKSKRCNLCHECDIDPDVRHSMYNH